MALDVQPLSRRRRVVMLVVLVGILAASLGLAELLTVRARERMQGGKQVGGRRAVDVRPPADDEE
ncbi:MAG: hypothetical protein FWD61_18205 [Phycisphaerales bacterium]|nr:hypothetical protein [Phycisphaerales bacterium]